MTRKSRKLIGTIVAILLLLSAGAWLYSRFNPSKVHPTGNTGLSATSVIVLMLIGLLLGVIITVLIVRNRKARRNRASEQTTITSHTLVESIKQVFKIVVAEGRMNEIFNYENTKKLLKFIPSTKKALVIVKGNVMIGYDFEKCRWDIDQENKTIYLKEFPEPEVLSVETDFNYYYFEEDLFNFIGRKDLHEIQTLAKEQIKESALQSGLTNIAAAQMKLLLQEVSTVNGWTINNMELIDKASAAAALPRPDETQPAQPAKLEPASENRSEEERKKIGSTLLKSEGTLKKIGKIFKKE